MNTYQESGYLVVKNAINMEEISYLLRKYLWLVNKHNDGPSEFTDAFDQALIMFFRQNRDILSTVYDEIRSYPWLEDFVIKSKIGDFANDIFHNVGISAGGEALKKIVMRMDMPLETSELALWHQDFFYVKGNPEVITAWIPLQDTYFEHGCLSVMPKSHLLGPINHNKIVLKKKHIPSDIYSNEIKYVEMKKGDILFFNALLLHTSNINISDIPRYSLQVRFSPRGFDIPPEMNGLINIKKET